MSSKSVLPVKTDKGPVQGFMEEDIFVFKGIPYAKPPIEDLRWRPPDEVEPWEKPLQAMDRGPACFQNVELCTAIGGGNPTPPELSEDCLYLNIWTSQLEKSAQLPVMVWIHGGGYVIGAGALPPYVGTPLAKRGAVVVNINYRLGHLGFFAHPALEAEYRKGEAVNNFALLDQIAALKWVQRNIELFGGNPDNVTIFGQSAGGRSVLSLFAAPGAHGLFHKGVAQSVYGLADMSRQEALQRGEAFAKYFRIDPAMDIPSQLRKLDANLFWQIGAKEKTTKPHRAAFGGPVPISGDSVLPAPLLAAFQHKSQAKLPLIIGNNSDDSSVLADFGFGPQDVIDFLKREGKYEEVKQKLYPGVRNDDELGRQVGRDVLFTTMAFVIVKYHDLAGAPGWRYYFDYVAQTERPKFPNGARHGDEVSYVLDTGAIAPPTDAYFSQQDKEFAQKVSQYWLEFAKSTTDSSETISGVKNWPKHTPVPDIGLPPNKTMGFGKDLGNTIDVLNNFMLLRVLAFEPVLNDLAISAGPDIHSYQGTVPTEIRKKTA